MYFVILRNQNTLRGMNRPGIGTNTVFDVVRSWSQPVDYYIKSREQLTYSVSPCYCVNLLITADVSSLRNSVSCVGFVALKWLLACDGVWFNQTSCITNAETNPGQQLLETMMPHIDRIYPYLIHNTAWIMDFSLNSKFISITNSPIYN